MRKVNPRNPRRSLGKGQDPDLPMLRHGIPYGPPYGPGQEDADRDLLFLAYHTSFHDQFRILNNVWMNNPSAPEKLGKDHDLIIGRDETGRARFGSFCDENGDERRRVSSLSLWVIPTGGAFLFYPSLKFFEMIGKNLSDDGL